jgi:hypothetical protein
MPAQDFIVDLILRSQQFGAEIRRVTNDLNTRLTQSLKSTLTSRLTGALALGSLAAASQRLVSFASRFADSSAKLGVGVQFLQAASYAAQQTGASFGDVELALKRLSVAQANALAGKKPDLESFTRFGVTLDDLKSKSIDQLFLQIATHVQTTAHSSQTLSDVLNLMGRSADSILPAMKQGFADLAAEAEKLGLILGPETIHTLDTLGDRLQALALRLAAIFGPVLVHVTEIVQRFIDLQKILLGGGFEFWKTLLTTGSTKKAAAAWGASLDAALDAYSKRQLANTPSAPKPVPPSLLDPGAGSPLPAPDAVHASYRPTVDQLARIGLFVTGGDPAQQTRKQTLVELKAIKHRLGDLKSTLEQTL